VSRCGPIEKELDALKQALAEALKGMEELKKDNTALKKKHI
jgi:hypothetical protein